MATGTLTEVIPGTITAADGFWSTFDAVDGPQLPDPISFVIGEAWLDRPNLYPRQATLLKIIFLRDDLFTEYDHQVIAEWIAEFHATNPNAGPDNKFQAKTNGIQPDIYERIAWLKERGYRWFKEVLMAVGRRGSKGYVCSLAMAYVLWAYLARGDPQDFYGIDRDKQLAVMIFAGKKEQAKANLWGDLYNAIVGSNCYAPYISEPQGESITIFAPHDEQRMIKLAERGIRSTKDLASFGVYPKESTLLAGRGPAACILGFDEAAHVKNAGTSREFGDVYKSAGPALDQFGKDAFIVIPSSTWEMTGKFYELWEQSLEQEPDDTGELTGVYPNKLMIQLASWDPYKDWEAAQDLELFPAGFEGDLGEYAGRELPRLQAMKGAIQIYDDDMAREERANPDTFGVERRCLDPATRVLTADLTWKPIGDVESGEQLIGLDEFAPRGKQRKLRTSTVLRTGRSHDRAYRLTFGDGSSVICSGTHRWFSDNRWRSIYPAPGVPGPRKILKVGDSIRWIVDPWDDDDSWEAGWLAGVYDGEGSFLGRGRGRQEFSLTVTQNPGPVLEKILSTLKDKGFAPVRHSRTRKAEQWYVTNLDECLRLVGQIKPLRFYARRQQLWEGRAPHGSRVRSKTKTIISIDELPEQELVDIETTTGTFIAEGLVSHNSHWATAMDAYLNPGKVDDMFAAWAARPEVFGRPELAMQVRGPLTVLYRAHGDPSNVNCRFGFAMAHTEPGPDKMLHAVFDLIHFWDPADYDDHFIDYDEVTDWIYDNVIMRFYPEELTFDQFNVPSTVKRLQKKVHAGHLPKRVQVYERPATNQLNWSTYETFKGALNMGFVHAPPHGEASQELKFLRKPEGQAKVVPPDSGPVVTKDIADCIAIVTADLLGEQMAVFLGAALGSQRPGAGMHSSQTDPMLRFSPENITNNPYASSLGGVALARGSHPGSNFAQRPMPGRTRLGRGAASFRRGRN